MRKWIKLIEAASDNRLYHGTSVIGFCNIVSDNKLGARGGENQASFTLDPLIAKQFALLAVDACKDGQLSHYADFYDDLNNEGSDGTPYVAYKAEMVAGGSGVVLAFDRSTLHNDYEFKSVNFDSHGIERIDFGYSGKEREECAFEDIHQLDKYLSGVSISREAFARYSCFVKEHLPNDPHAMKVLEAGEAFVKRFS